MHMFSEILEFLWNSCTKVCKADQVDFIFDSYIENSIKEGERQRRSAVGAPLQFVRLEETTLIPVQIERFWSCSRNKEMLQILAKCYSERKAFNAGHKTVLSGIVSDMDGVISGQKNSRSESFNREDLHAQMWLEEAEVPVIPHILKAVSNGVERVVVLSNDTDVVVLLVFYIFDFFSLGLKECWIRVGTGEKTRLIPIHNLGRKLRHRTCSAVMKAHILTGCDVTSKIGTKTAAIKVNPESYLHNFGEENNPSTKSILKAEAYLVCVPDKNSPAKSFDELRYLRYNTKTSHCLNSYQHRTHFRVI